MSSLEIMANNFRFHDKSLRAAGYGMKAISCTKRMKGSEIATIMNKVGSKISWIRQTLRIGSEFAIYKGLFQMFKKKATTNPLEWWSQLLEYFIGVYFYIIDHIDWASTNHLLKISKAWKSWITLESTRAWLYSTIAITIHRLAGIYNACKTLKQADKLNLSDQQKQKIRKTRKTLIFMFIKGLVDFGHITYYLKPEIAARDTPEPLPQNPILTTHPIKSPFLLKSQNPTFFKNSQPKFAEFLNFFLNFEGI